VPQAEIACGACVTRVTRGARVWAYDFRFSGAAGAARFSKKCNAPGGSGGSELKTFLDLRLAWWNGFTRMVERLHHESEHTDVDKVWIRPK
jgi:hypothetical protein